MKDLVVGIDSSTQSTKAMAWTPTGQLVAEGRSPVALHNPRLYCFEQNSRDWWDSCRQALRAVTDQVKPERIAGISISNQRETVAFLDEDGQEIRPAMVWLDERSRREVDELASQIGADVIHEITGRPVDTTPALYRLAWLKANEPENFKKTKCFADVQAYLVHKLSGKLKTGWFSADPMGYFDIRQKVWSQVLLDYLGLSPERLPEPFAPGTIIGHVTAEAARQTGLPPKTPIFAGGGDGQCAALGTNCISSERAYINLGTAVVSGVWLPNCLNSKAWRTEISPTGEGYILETCLKSGAFLINWFVDQFLPGDRREKDFFKKLEQKAQAIPVGSDGLVTLPYWSGVMNPHWNPNGRGCFIGLSGDHTPVHLYRSILEGMCLDQAQATAAVESETGLRIEKFVAIGGGASSPLWTRMLADSTGKDVALSDTLEASALGAAMIAAQGAGWFSSFKEAAAAMCGPTRTVEPDTQARQVWDELREIYGRLFPDNEKTFNALVKFAVKSLQAPAK
ncbi:MAG: FGGY-family carbohydrate kinase [Desulfobacterales bacterium]|nr:MAG: FGGY-family carbohydrate kinase [Desulfobacterales bacterium]